MTDNSTARDDPDPLPDSVGGGEAVPTWLIELTEDRPLTGMWHCGPNAAWVTVTHLPTMISARAFDQSHHKAKQAAQACCEMMVEQSRLLKCQFPERLAPPTALNNKDEEHG